MEASSSRLPSYTPPSKDAICFIPSLSALHPDPTHPAHAALLSNIDLKKDSVKIFSFSQGGIILCPEKVGDAVEEEESWAKAGGYLQVVSSQRRIAQQVLVKIISQQSLAFPVDRGGREDDLVFSREIVLEDVQLEKGLNTFEFLLTIPHSAPTHAGSTRNPKSFATVFQKAIGTVSGSKGLFGTKDLVVEEQVWIVAAPSPETFSESLRLNIAAEGHTDELGPVSLKVSSSTFVVAGPLFLSVTLHSPPPNLRVYALKCYIEQKADLTSFRFPATKTARIPLKGMVFETGWEGPYGAKSLAQMLADGRGEKEMLFDVSEGGEWVFEQVGRIPDDTVLRPTTHAQTTSSIRISTQLVVDLYFTLTPTDPPALPTKVMIASVLSQPVFLAGCGCLPKRLSLPDYTPDAERFVPIDVPVPCKCDEPTDSLLEAEREWLKSSRSSIVTQQGLDDSISVGRKVGEDY